MRFYFNAMSESKVDNFKNGDGPIFIRKAVRENYMVMQFKIPSKSSIGLHKHETNMEVFNVISGEGIVICDGVEEPLSEGVCHICPKGSTHTIISTGEEDLILRTTIIEC